MSLRQTILDNVEADMRDAVAWALDLAKIDEVEGLLLTFRDYASDMASGHLRGLQGQSYESVGRDDLALLNQFFPA